MTRILQQLSCYQLSGHLSSQQRSCGCLNAAQLLSVQDGLCFAQLASLRSAGCGRGDDILSGSVTQRNRRRSVGLGKIETLSADKMEGDE